MRKTENGGHDKCYGGSVSLLSESICLDPGKHVCLIVRWAYQSDGAQNFGMKTKMSFAMVLSSRSPI
jgi:hypothetical protein